MSDDQDEQANPPTAPSDLPEPKCFIVSPVTDGGFAKRLPTLTAVYTGMPVSLNPEILSRVDGGTVDFDDTEPGKIQLAIFLVPKNSETDAFNDVFSYDLAADAKTVELFRDNLVKVKCFVFAISADDFYFQCKIDVKSSNTVESTCDYRLLH
jgi:hypothetical protein